MVSKETFQKVKNALRRGDQPEIARRTGLSKVWVNQVLNCKRGAESEEAQKAILDAAIDIITKRQIREKKAEQKYLDKTNDLLG